VEQADVATLRVRVPAKVNLHLAVGPRRPDGYHDLVSVMQTVSLFDMLRLRLNGASAAAHPSARRLTTVTLTVEGNGDGSGGADGVPADGSNLVMVAARRLMDRLGIDGGPATVHSIPHATAAATRLHLAKRIPVAAGMAGGSADAAAALVGLDALWRADLGADGLRDLAADVGSDVPFCLVGGTVLATGTGTSIARVLTRGTWHWVIGVDDVPLSTRAVYGAFDELPPPRPSAPDLVLHALLTGDADALAAGLHNDLEPAAFALRPVLAERREAMLEAGALAAIVSGSGPTLVGLARDARHARQLAEGLAGVFPRVETASSPAGGPEMLRD
jgi:4-diphosphocytidyl-2-C-methyl-D-erythritol kinase